MPSRHNPTERPRKTRPVKGADNNWRKGISRELEKARRLFVLGIGNCRKGDDAAGSLCIRLLTGELRPKRRHPDAQAETAGPPRKSLRRFPSLEVQVLDAGEAPESVTGFIREFRPTHVLIVDAAAAGHRPGTIFVIDRKKITQEDVSTHRLPLSLLARYLEESLVCRVILVGIEPRVIAWGRPVSAAVRMAAARLAAWLAENLTARRS
jgi:hydrogenase 3 maturation protease